MAPVTEFVLATIKPDADLPSLYTTFATLKSQPGSQRVRAATLHEDAQQLRLFVDWDAVSDQHAFRASAAYSSFISAIAPSLAGGPTTVLHAELAPHPPTVLNNTNDGGKTGVAEVLFTYFTPSADPTKNLATAQTLVSGLSGAGFAGIRGESAVGWTVERDVDYKGEKTRVLVVLIGWESVEAHRAARATEAYGKIVKEFQGAAEGLRGFDISHVSTKTL
ncbi:hypothetical protein F4821DRAFT_258163 [Hypoxylon rubiginosum]|uniref:Uncharacterized protein n=1 Tax=Hypoxylon rubiginosum TaxID=110542 RepID=A0ACC0D6R7_9PEZI|nr:hypothetical protein F4821DRAFT_258163 [Hypoxylon rubiginosum]